MCDCYTARCKNCNREIPMHLGDYATARDEIEVFCTTCLPADLSDGALWLWADRDGDDIDAPIGPLSLCFMRNLTSNAAACWDGNHPNSWVVWCILRPGGKEPFRIQW